MAATLTDLDYGQAPWDSQHCVTLINEGDLREVGRRLGTAADEATDLLLVYYAGRGILDRRNRSLYLGLPDSDPKRPGFSSLEYAKLRDTVLDSRAAMKVIVLDSRFPCDIDDLGDQLDVRDGYVLASSFGEEVSFAEPGEMHTAFSTHLNTVLREGVPGGPGLLRIDDIYLHLLERMRRDGLPQPEARGTYVDGPLALIRNRGSYSIARLEPVAEPAAPMPSARDDDDRTDTAEPAVEPVVESSDGGREEPEPLWFNEWMLEWMAYHADRLAEHAPGVASVLLARAVASVEAESERYAWFASRLAEAFFHSGELEQAQDLASLALDRTDDVDVRVRLQSTLAQCLDKAGARSDALAVLGRALGASGLTAGHRAGLLVLAARSHTHLREFRQASEIASEALKAASESGDESAADWALHIISMAKAMEAADAEESSAASAASASAAGVAASAPAPAPASVGVAAASASASAADADEPSETEAEVSDERPPDLPFRLPRQMSDTR